MRFLVLSDMHDDDVFIHQLKEEFQQADGVIFGGDFAKYSQSETAEPALRRLVDCHQSVYAVLGNCDEPDFLTRLEEEDICVQGSMVFRDGLVFAGSGGGSRFTGTTPNERSDQELASDFQIVLDQLRDNGHPVRAFKTQGVHDTLVSVHMGTSLRKQVFFTKEHGIHKMLVKAAVAA